MSNQAVLQQLPSTGEHHTSYVWIIAAVAAISGFLFGFDTAVINGALVFLQRQFALTSLLTEIAASSLLLGCLIGAACAGLCGDRLGRRKSLMFTALLFAASAIGSAIGIGILAAFFTNWQLAALGETSWRWMFGVAAVPAIGYLSITAALGVSGAFLLYAALSLITFFFVGKWVPETRGKSLEQIQNMWGK